MPKMVRSFLYSALAITLLVTGIWHCFSSKKPFPPYQDCALDVVYQWQDQLLHISQRSEGYRPPVSARMFAYMGLAAWESSIPAFKDALSLEAKLAGLHLPQRSYQEGFLVDVALNATYFTMIKHFFPHTNRNVQQQYRKLASHFDQLFKQKYALSDIAAAEQLGRAVADSIFFWSATDSIGHEAYLYNYDRSYQPPSGPGQWSISPDHPMPPLLPYWGKSRTFIVNPAQNPDHLPVPFSEKVGSDFFAQAMEVYSLSIPMTEEKRWIAEFWSDDAPGVSICAASRWISISCQALKSNGCSLPKALETLLKIGLALNDTSVKVWQEKYTHCVQRPEAYIKKSVDASWTPLHEAPGFPAYPSGHAGFAAAAAAILTRQLGNNFPITDRTHEGRKEFLGVPRHFKSFGEMAKESSLSRLYLGVHYRMDVEEGLRVGTIIGEKISDLNIYNRNLSVYN